MITIRDRVFVRYENGVCSERMEIDVDTADDLPAANYFSGRRIHQGSLAHDISTGDFYSMDSTGTWYAQDGSGPYTPGEE